MQYLFVTVKRVGKRMPTEADYENWLRALENHQFKLEICKKVIETDQNNRKHLHMIIMVDFLFDWNCLKLYKTNWHVHTLKIDSDRDLKNISEYMDKEDNDDGFRGFIEQRDNGEYLFQTKTA